MLDKEYYTVDEFAKLIGVTDRTLRLWDKDGKFKARRTITGKPFYTKADYKRYYGEE